MRKTSTPPIVFTPGEAAARLGLTVPDLVAIINANRYPFFEKKPGGRPGAPGRNRWGLTEDHIRAILRGQERVPPDLTRCEEGRARPSALSPDGKSRLRK